MDTSVKDALAGATWLYAANFSNTIMGFIFWLVVARLAGAESVGVAGVLVSSAGIAFSVLAAGMFLAVIREVAARGGQAATSALLLSITVGLAAGALASILASAAGFRGLWPYAYLIAFSLSTGQGVMSVLMGSAMFRGYFLAAVSNSMVKLAVATTFALAGYRLLAPIAGIIAGPLVASALGLAVLALFSSLKPPSLEALRDIVVLAASNYPYAFSIQLLTSLGVYLFSHFAGGAVDTGALYISLMAVMVLAFIPGALQLSALSLSTRRGGDPHWEALRLGLAIVTPLVALVVAAPSRVLGLISGELASAGDALRILALAVAPLSLTTAAMASLNRVKSVRRIVAVGVSGLAGLLATLPPLASYMGLEGAALAFLASSIISAMAAIALLKPPIQPLIAAWTTHFTIAALSWAGLIGGVAGALFAVAFSVLAVYITGLMSPGEAIEVVRIVVSTLLNVKVRKR